MLTTKERVVSILKELKKELEIFFNNIPEPLDNKTIWQIRQKLKKIKAVITVFRKIIKPEKELLEAHRIIFKSLGNLRDIYQKIEILETYSKNNNVDVEVLITILNTETTEYKKTLIKNLYTTYPRILIEKLEQYLNNLKKEKNKELEKTIISFILKRYKKIDKLCMEPINPEILHKIRIHIKQIINIIKLTKINPFHFEEYFTLKEINCVDKVLGKWHDINLLYQYLFEKTQAQDELKQKKEIKKTLNYFDKLDMKLFNKSIELLNNKFLNKNKNSTT